LRFSARHHTHTLSTSLSCRTSYSGRVQTWQVILEGAIGGVVVLVGVFAGEVLIRSRSHRDLIRDRVQELTVLLPKYLAHFTRKPDWPSPTDPGFTPLSERVLVCLADIRFSARPPLRRHKDLRREAEDLSGRTYAAYFRWEKGGSVQPSEIANIGVNRVRSVLMGESYSSLDALIKRYEADGFPPYPSND
jgi:hypothetical protein